MPSPVRQRAARAIHATGSRAARPLVAVNCDGIVGTLAESLLFGHEKGSFTGADDATSGAFRAADRGILFRDEIGELPLDIQPKLLRALELREPLRDRRDDIPLFVAHFAAECAERFDRPGWTLPDEAIRRFMNHSWPGNVRELRQTILRIAIFEDRLDEILDEMDVTRSAVPPASKPAPAPPPVSAEAFNLDELRRDAVRRALATTGGHYGRAAALLGVSPKTMTKFAAEAYPGQQAKRGRRRKPLPR